MKTNRVGATSGGRRLRLMAALGGLSLLVFAGVTWRGCRTYPAVSSPESLYMMKLLYSSCSAKDPARLAKLKSDLAQAVGHGKVTPAEEAAFHSIIAMADRGEWEDAQIAALAFAEDQIGRGHPSTHGHNHVD